METDRARVLRGRAARARDALRPRQTRVDRGRVPVPARCCATPVLLARLQRAQFHRPKTSRRFEPGDWTSIPRPDCKWRTRSGAWIFSYARQSFVTTCRLNVTLRFDLSLASADLGKDSCTKRRELSAFAKSVASLLAPVDNLRGALIGSPAVAASEASVLRRLTVRQGFEL